MNDDARAYSGPNEPEADDGSVPLWLAGIVVALLIAAIALGAVAAKRVLSPASGPAATAQELAVRAAEQSAKADPNSAQAALQYAYALQQDGRLDEAAAQYERVLSVDPKNLAATYNVGVIAGLQGRPEQAEAAYKKVLAADPGHALAARSLAEVYASQSRYDAVVRILTPVVQAHPTLADVQFQLGSAYEELGNAAKARARYRAALRYAPDLTEARRALDRLGGAQ